MPYIIAVVAASSISKSINILKWHPKYTAEIAIQNTVNWYLAYSKCASNIDIFTFEQIEEFRLM